MMKRQVFTSTDYLKGFKESKVKKFQDCAFFNHEINDKPIDIGLGYFNESIIKESIVTDGTISLQRKNLYSPSIIWQEHFITLENGTSISIEIKNATFMLVITNYLGEKQVDIHVTEESRTLLQNILDFFYGKQTGKFETSSISFTSPTVIMLESIVNGQKHLEAIDLDEGRTQYKKRKPHKRH